jgi:hypothetical protein
MIDSLTIKFGPTGTDTPLRVKVAPVTIFVGPNNSGKSKILSELHTFCRHGVINADNVLINNIQLFKLLDSSIPEIIDSITVPPAVGQIVRKDHIVIDVDGKSQQIVTETYLNNVLRNPMYSLELFCKWCVSPRTLLIDGKARVSLVAEQPAGDLQKPLKNVLAILFRDDLKRAEVRRVLNEAFRVHFVIDPTDLGKLRIRLSDVAPPTPLHERGIHEEAVCFHKNALSIQNASDGVKAFTGIITTIIASDPSIMLIDEPEAFLHPSLAFNLGKEVAISAAKADKRLFVSTHSARFVMGCIQSGVPVNIVRLTYGGETPTARLLPNDKLLRLMRNPLLRSSGVLDGLFFQSVVVTESDADRAFYQEVNERLLRYSPSRGIPNCLFLNAQNKQTIHQILQPLRELGIPAASVVDVDVLKDGGKTWTDYLRGAFVPNASHVGLGDIRAKIRDRCDKSGKDMKRNGGIHILEADDREAANNLFDQLADYGLFVVRSGELESWLRGLGATGHGPGWLIQVFEKMGENPDDPAYVKPAGNDVWAFVESIGTWLKNSKRKGIPASVGG